MCVLQHPTGKLVVIDLTSSLDTDTSSNDDHFSDAQEGPSNENMNERISISSATDTLDAIPIITAMLEDTSIAIPGAFGSDELDDEDASLSNPKSDAQAKSAASRLKETAAGDASSELVNEKKHVIVGRVKEESEKIEQRLAEHQERSRSERSTPSFHDSRNNSLAPTAENPEPKSEDSNSRADVSDEGTKSAIAKVSANIPDTLETMAVADEEVPNQEHTEDPTHEDGSGDDFDDFGETVEADGGGGFDDFGGFEASDNVTGDFGEPVQEPVQASESAPAPQVPVSQLPVPLPDFNDHATVSFAVAKMFPVQGEQRSPTSIEGRSFLTDRSQSLWNQLVAPPSLQPPNWKISPIRRLFLVSLGIPLDLDEILPTETKQKKLVLPSIHLRVDSRPSPRKSSRHSDSLSRKKKADGREINLLLDIPSARILCSTSPMALRGFTTEELREHIRKLEEMTQIASAVLTYWLGKRDGAVGDKETFETVIEGLVGYARKKRQYG
ncbi:hypothetical protein FN846DRAFT_931734 [Sphaerosporella brunnea]|uniref:Uncharacterized protein n=1 Tax=Sphaerosporella brunnea TaxID=1250544 RepID=A0A5J5F899_9PEZI|nr:hypothetical protein FN846DRAFT_931734 [Sphaerosporella brunnea]